MNIPFEVTDDGQNPGHLNVKVQNMRLSLKNQKSLFAKKHKRNDILKSKKYHLDSSTLRQSKMNSVLSSRAMSQSQYQENKKKEAQKENETTKNQLVIDVAQKQVIKPPQFQMEVMKNNPVKTSNLLQPTVTTIAFTERKSNQFLQVKSTNQKKYFDDQNQSYMDLNPKLSERSEEPIQPERWYQNYFLFCLFGLSIYTITLLLSFALIFPIFIMDLFSICFSCYFSFGKQFLTLYEKVVQFNIKLAPRHKKNRFIEWIFYLPTFIVFFLIIFFIHVIGIFSLSYVLMFQYYKVPYWSIQQVWIELLMIGHHEKGK